MKLKGKKLKQSLPVAILDGYKTYVSFGYPEDPAVYVIRGNKATCDLLREMDDNLQYSNKKGESFFMGFRIECLQYLPEGRIIFGPETIEFDWSV